MRRTAFTLLLSGLITSGAVAAEKFTIKLKHDTQGNVVQDTATGSNSEKTSFSFMGQAQNKNEESTSSESFREDMLEKKPGKKATKLKRIYQKAEATKDGKKLELTLVGKEILITRDGMKYKYTIDGKELTGDDAVFLEMQYPGGKDDSDDTTMDEVLFPKQAVAVDEPWKVDVAAAAKDLEKKAGITVDPAKSSGSGKLVKAYKKDGRQFGVIEINMELALTKLSVMGAMFDLDATSKTKTTFNFDCCIDGSIQTGTERFAEQTKLAGELKTPDGKLVKLDVSLNRKSTQNMEEVSGKK